MNIEEKTQQKFQILTNWIENENVVELKYDDIRKMCMKALWTIDRRTISNYLELLIANDVLRRKPTNISVFVVNRNFFSEKIKKNNQDDGSNE